MRAYENYTRNENHQQNANYHLSVGDFSFWEQVLGTAQQPGQKVIELAPEVIKKLNVYYALIMSEANGWGELSIKIDNYGKRAVVSLSMRVGKNLVVRSLRKIPVKY